MDWKYSALVAVAVAAIGCGGGGSGPSSAPTAGGITSTATPASASYTPPNVLAGMPVSVSTDAKPYKNLVANAKFGSRQDPFALTAEEAAYDRKQNTERVISGMGGFSNEYEEPPQETKDIPQDEVQPYRRLAGIIVGDSVLAIIDMGSGQANTIIRPGMKIPNTEWTVVSIDQEKAILHRDGPIGPHTISVRLESPPPGMTGGGFNGFGAPGGSGGRGGGGGPSMGGMAGAGGGGKQGGGNSAGASD